MPGSVLLGTRACAFAAFTFASACLLQHLLPACQVANIAFAVSLPACLRCHTCPLKPRTGHGYSPNSLVLLHFVAFWHAFSLLFFCLPVPSVPIALRQTTFLLPSLCIISLSPISPHAHIWKGQDRRMGSGRLGGAGAVGQDGQTDRQWTFVDNV